MVRVGSSCSRPTTGYRAHNMDPPPELTIDHEKLADYLSDEDVDPNKLDAETGLTSLQMCVFIRRLEDIKVFAAHPRVDVNRRTADGQTALSMCTFNSQDPAKMDVWCGVIYTLLKHGADYRVEILPPVSPQRAPYYVSTPNTRDEKEWFANHHSVIDRMRLLMTILSARNIPRIGTHALIRTLPRELVRMVEKALYAPVIQAFVTHL